MSVNIYKCGFSEPLAHNRAKNIEKLIITENSADILFSKSCIVCKYEYLYRRESKRFGECTPYALPGKNKNMKIYNGLDREPLGYTPDDAARYSYGEMQKIRQSLDNKDDLEVIFVRVSGFDADVPQGLEFLGYDVGYPPDGDGFSAICDCMFLCRWHGCDENGTEFDAEFNQLNKNGLFDTEQQAEDYLYHYLSCEWAEMGEFCILEIYR